MKSVIVRVTHRIDNVPGTSAQLQTGDTLSLHDLLYGLMLPSGNDASVVVADAVGKLIQRHKKVLTRRTYY
jgi:D-alanyl-D-alanine carboxypeptidase (penicillin-binding protein 5/6)